MCGIAGVVSTHGEDLAERMRSMRDRLVHRGPDAGGEFVEPGVALGVRRLRVIDLVTGDQPQSNEERTVWTVFNGEIYNFQELRIELVRRGHRLRTNSDTETIVHLYEDEGEAFVEALEGMFALAVWDSTRRKLILARDRLGKKPLVYWASNGMLAFASEHHSLLAGLADRPGVDRAAIGLYLRLGYVPAPHDAFEGIRKLQPATVLTWQEGSLTQRRYWLPPQPGTLAIEEDEAAEHLRRLIDRAVARRLVADVPVGAFLSGGVDSSVVVATMAKLTSKVRTFTIGFDDPEFSELEHARRVAARFGTEHHELVVRPAHTDAIPQLVRHYGEPYADSSAVPTYFLSKLTREHVTVALNGDGGDELFGGYDRYAAVRLASLGDRIPRSLRASGARLLSALIPDSISPNSLSRRARRFLQAAALPPLERYLRWLSVFDQGQLGALVSDEFAATVPIAGLAERIGLNGSFRGDQVAAAQLLDLRLYLPDDLLVKVDIASMASSLEVRCPFLDRELVEFAVRLPTRLKLRGGRRKYLLKRAFDGLVPSANLHRRKQGFGVPLGRWFREDLRSFTEEVVLSPRALERGYFRPEALRDLVREHVTGRVDHMHRLWALLMLELWHLEFVDR